MTRRSFLVGGGGAVSSLAGPAPAMPAIRLEIGNYGMQALSVDRALALIRETGYDGAELCCMQGWPSEPKLLDAAGRRRVRESGFPIPTLIEGFNLLAPADVHLVTLDRIRAAAALAQDLSPGSPPILQTVMGGKPGEWDAVRDTMAARLQEWAAAAGAGKIRFAVKAHAMNAVDTPDKLLWLLDRVRHPALTAIYDYGHFQLRGLEIEPTMEQLLPRSSFLTVKDSKFVNGEPRFLLPGDGTIDYERYFRKVKAMNWRGWVLVEVTRQLQTQSGYDPAAAARRSYARLAPVLRKLDLR